MDQTTEFETTTSVRSYEQIVTKLLRHNALPQLKKVIEKTLPADLSPVIPLLEDEDRRRLLILLIEARKAGRVLLEIDRDELLYLVGQLDDDTVEAICTSSAPDDAADLLDLLDDDRRERILAGLDQGESAHLEGLLVHDRPTAGSVMTTDYLALRDVLTVGAAIEEIRKYPRKDTFFYVYAVDGEDRLVGVLSLRSLILAPPTVQVKSIMVHHVVRTTVDASQEDVAQLVAKYDLLSVPVVDSRNHLVGVVTVDDVLDVIQEEAEEDLLHLAGVAPSERVTSSVLTSFRTRIPWLLVNLVTAFIAASVVRSFEGTIAQWAALAAFMPIVAGMGGNAGTQTLTLFVRGIALGEIDWSDRFAPVLKELFVGVANGVVNGLLTGLIVGLWTGDWRLALILFCAMTINMIVAGVAGGLVPLTLKELGFDPAISSSIFVTTCTDVAGFFTFLGLATLALHYWS